MNNKANIENNIILILIIGAGFMFVVLLFFMVSLIGPPSVGLGLEFIDNSQVLIEGIEITANENLSSIADPQLENIKSFTNIFRYFSYGFFIIIFLAFLVFAYFTRTYPYMAFIWIFVVVALVIASIWLTNSYVSFASTEGFGDYYNQWPESDFAVRFLPHIIGVMGFFMGIILFIVATSDRETEEVQII